MKIKSFKNMKYCKVITEINKIDWNEHVQNPMQSYEWGQSRIALGENLVRFGVHKEETLLYVFHMTLKRIPFTSYLLGTVIRSPLIDDEALISLKKYAKQNKIALIHFEPDVFFEDQASVSNILKKSDQHIFASDTQYIDVTRKEEEIFENFSKTVRRDIRFGQKNGLYSKIGNSLELYSDFENLLFQTTERQNFLSYTKTYHQIVFENTKDAISFIIVVYDQNNKAVAASQFFIFKNTLYYIYAGSLGKQTPVGGMYILIWDMIKYGISKGCTLVDLWGSLPESHSLKHPWSGFTRFKKSFGTYFKKYIGSYDLIISYYPYFIFKILYRLKKVLTFIKKKLL